MRPTAAERFELRPCPAPREGSQHVAGSLVLLGLSDHPAFYA
jgi:hypothetical protein